MRIKSLALAASILLCLFLNGMAWGANGSQPSNQQQTSNTEKELLMFFEEQDLVTATKRATPLHKAPAIATVITADEIRNMGARNLLDVLKMVPGFGISITESGVDMVEVRGIRTALSEKVLFMIDGHSLNKNITGSALWTFAEMLPVENIKQIEVVRGPGSALYGSSAFLATVNIITRDADEINGIEAKAGGGNFDTYKGNIVGGKTLADKFSISGSLDRYKTNGPNLKVQADALSGTGFSLAPGNANLEFRQTDAFIKIAYGDLSFRGGYRTAYKDQFIGLGFALTNDDSYQKIETYWGEIAYSLRVTDELSSTLKIYSDYYSQTPNVKIFPNGFPGFPDGMIGRPFVKDRTYGSELQFDLDPFKGNHVILGTSFEAMRQYDVKQFANFDPNTFAPIGSVQEVAAWNKDKTRTIFASYLQDEWQILQNLNLTTGVRYDHYSDFGNTVNPRAAVVWNFIENADLKLLYGQAFRAPNLVELYNINNPVQTGNPDLKPEKIRTYEAGVTYRFAWWLSADLNYFYSEITDLIILNTALTPATYANIGKATTQGIELGLNGVYGRNIHWKINYAYQDPRDAITHNRLPDVPSQRATAGINYALTKYLNLHSDILWTGSRPRSEGDNRRSSPSYTTVDLAATLKNFWKNLEIQAAIHNLFDKRYFDPDTSGAQEKVPGDFPREGISALATATYKF